MQNNNNVPFATVEHENGQVYIGVIIPVDTYTFKVDTGRRGRPTVIHTSQVVEVLPVDKHNPHVAF